MVSNDFNSLAIVFYIMSKRYLKLLKELFYALILIPGLQNILHIHSIKMNIAGNDVILPLTFLKRINFIIPINTVMAIIYLRKSL